MLTEQDVMVHCLLDLRQTTTEVGHRGSLGAGNASERLEIEQVGNGHDRNDQLAGAQLRDERLEDGAWVEVESGGRFETERLGCRVVVVLVYRVRNAALVEEPRCRRLHGPSVPSRIGLPHGHTRQTRDC